MRPLRVGVIGAGTIALSAHLPAIARLKGRVELVAIADVRAEVAERAAARYGAEAAYGDYRQLLDRTDIDLVDICTPEFLHAEQTIAAAAAGKHVLCEKPMAATVAEADAMLDACRRAGVRLMIAHSRRFTPRYQRIRTAIDRGDVGEVRFVRENERRPRAMYEALAEPTDYWNPRAGEGDARPWISLAGYSQGAALTNAVHETDLIRWFVGAEPVAIYAESRITDPQGEVPDFLTCLIRFANGAIGGTEVVNRLPSGYSVYHQIEVIGTEGAIRAFDTEMAPLRISGTDGTRFPANWDTLLHIGAAYEAEIRGFAESILSDGPVPMDPWEARQALAMSLAAVTSSKERRWVGLDAIPATGEDRA
ncbi:MAG: myo-inositol 2-dehydrogenase / D-chiro-inositol 1-dehydrogenase [Thermomicrobiales bacterium]|jgi:predicted dehydrogenase|nr:myo-inositol 2-dehydrogenase / D-chiro-inositol 1-dehydrogenase [Thermomicrobiales bacterium]